MNSAEKKFFLLALFLFSLGIVSRLGFLNKLYPLEIISLPVNSEFSETIIIATESDSIILSDSNYSENLSDSHSFETKKKEKKQKKQPAFPININTASKDDLCFIKGVGPSIAQKIIDHREKKGYFRTIKDLEKVPGIGAKKRQSMEEFIKFE